MSYGRVKVRPCQPGSGAVVLYDRIEVRQTTCCHDAGHLLVVALSCRPIAICDAMAASRVVTRDFGAAFEIAGGNTTGWMLAHEPLLPGCDAAESLVAPSLVLSR